MKDDPEIRVQLREAFYRVQALARFRLVGVLVFIVISLFIQSTTSSHFSTALRPLALLYILGTLLFARWAARQHSLVAVERINTANYYFDLVLMAAACYLLGPFRHFMPLYFIFVITYGGLNLRPGAAVLLALIGSLLYSAVLMLVAEGVLPLPPGEVVPDYTWVLRSCLGAIGIFVLCALTLSFFADLLRRKTAQAERANRRLRAVAARLRCHQEELERAVNERTRDLQTAYRHLKVANQELRRIDKLKTYFLANVSHELRTPLTSIRSFSEILRAYPDQDPAAQGEFLDIIIAECQRLGRLIDDLLDLSRIESGHAAWDFQPVRLQETVAACARAVQPLADQQELTLTVECDDSLPPVPADPDRISQVLTNLLSNSLHFTQEGGITISVRGDDGVVRVVVADTGCGVPDIALEHLFEKFYQVQMGEGLAHKPAGTGLGLAICKEIVEHHGGRIWAESNHPQGLLVQFELPLADGEAKLPLPHLSPDEAEVLLVGVPSPGGVPLGRRQKA